MSMFRVWTGGGKENWILCKAIALVYHWAIAQGWYNLQPALTKMVFLPLFSISEVKLAYQPTTY